MDWNTAEMNSHLYSEFIGIMPYAFSDCRELIYVDLSDMYSGSIDACAFENCTSLNTVIFNNDFRGSIDETAFDGCDKSKLVLYCSEGSIVEEYAKNHEIMYKYNVDIPKDAERVYGDFDKNYCVNANDAAILMQYILNQTDSYCDSYVIWNFEYLDVNMDGEINSADVAEILQKALDSSYLMPCEKQ